MKVRLLTALLAAFISLTASFAQDVPHVRVLSIGNSFSRDAFSYVPFIIEELVPGAQVDFGILYIGGCTLERHYNNMVENKPAYDFDRYHTGDGRWTMTKEVSIEQGLAAEDWDIVILQQQSSRSRYYSTYQPYLNHLEDYVLEKRPHAKLAWLLTQAYGTGYKDLDGMSSDEMWARTDESSERVLNETKVSILIPAGTGIQNARYTPLDRFGKFGHLVHDGYHLQEGVAPYIEGLVAAHSLMREYGVNLDVTKSQMKITHEWWQPKHTPQPNGEPEEATDEDWITARKCALWAIEKPYQLTIVHVRH